RRHTASGSSIPRCRSLARATPLVGGLRQRDLGGDGFHPYRRIVEHGAAEGWGRVVAGQRVDADAALEIGVRPYALDDHHTGLHAVEQLGVDHDLATLVAEPHPRALHNAK